MDGTTPACRHEKRRQIIRDQGANGIDYVEVSEDQLFLCVHFFGRIPDNLNRANVRIDGGRRIRDIQVVEIDIRRQEDYELEDCLGVWVEQPGDFSTYTLHLVELDEHGQPTNKPLHVLDPRYAQIGFSFKVDCPSDLDCTAEIVCPPEVPDEPGINCLAKDYASFRRLIFDRLALIMPDWQERHVPDLGVTLVELLAYIGDYLSYYQDAVATEAYLDTARQRISIRRQAGLVDYQMHEGCNARTWVCIETDMNISLNPKNLYLMTGCVELSQTGGGLIKGEDLHNIPFSHYEVFEPLAEDHHTPIQLFETHNTIHFYTWGEPECCLPRGATQAALRDAWELVFKEEPQTSDLAKSHEEPASRTSSQTKAQKAKQPTLKRKLRLQAGDILIFEEVKGPATGEAADADPLRRHAVRLTRVQPGEDCLLTQKILGSEKPLPTPVIEIAWAPEDALPFPLCLSARKPAPECTLVNEISVAHGNVILVDHGRTVYEPLGTVGKKSTIGECECDGSAVDLTDVPDKFQPILQQAPVTFAQPVTSQPPASSILVQEPRRALPEITLYSLPGAPEDQVAVSLCGLYDPEDPGLLAMALKKAEASLTGSLMEALSNRTKELLQQYDGASPLSTELKAALTSELRGMIQLWTARRDLLESQGQDRHFVTEIDNDNRAHLRFGDGDLGKIPDAGLKFIGRYRTGNGPAGNIGAEAISYIVLRQGGLSGVKLRPRNPLPARGATAPEPLAEVKLLAPHDFRRELQRAITADDYAGLAAGHRRVQRAAAALRWTGSWHEAQVAIDPLGTEEPDNRLLHEIKGHLFRYRRMGHDLAVSPAAYVPIELSMQVCVLPHYLRGHVEAALLDLLSNRLLADGRRGFFHPDNLTFGNGIYVSQLEAAAQAVPGVQSVTVLTLKRLDEGPNHELENGVLPLVPREIAQLNNDPSFPEHGKLTLIMGGGR